MVYSEKCVKMSFHVIHFYTERALGRPERNVCPALHNDAAMTCCVSGSELTSEDCENGFRFIFLVCSIDNRKAAKLQMNTAIFRKVPIFYMLRGYMQLSDSIKADGKQENPLMIENIFSFSPDCRLNSNSNMK